MDNVWDHAQTISTISIYLVTLEFIISKTLSCNFVYFSVTGSPVAGLSFLVMNLLFSLVNLFLLVTFILSLFIHYIFFVLKFSPVPHPLISYPWPMTKSLRLRKFLLKMLILYAFDTKWLWLCHFTSLIYFLLCKLRIGVLLHGQRKWFIF